MTLRTPSAVFVLVIVAVPGDSFLLSPFDFQVSVIYAPQALVGVLCLSSDGMPIRAFLSRFFCLRESVLKPEAGDWDIWVVMFRP